MDHCSRVGAGAAFVREVTVTGTATAMRDPGLTAGGFWPGTSNSTPVVTSWPIAGAFTTPTASCSELTRFEAVAVTVTVAELVTTAAAVAFDLLDVDGLFVFEPVAVFCDFVGLVGNEADVSTGRAEAGADNDRASGSVCARPNAFITRSVRSVSGAAGRDGSRSARRTLLSSVCRSDDERAVDVEVTRVLSKAATATPGRCCCFSCAAAAFTSVSDEVVASEDDVRCALFDVRVDVEPRAAPLDLTRFFGGPSGGAGAGVSTATLSTTTLKRKRRRTSSFSTCSVSPTSARVPIDEATITRVSSAHMYSVLYSMK